MSFFLDRCFLLILLLIVSRGFTQEQQLDKQDSTSLPTIYLPGHLYPSGEQVWDLSIADMDQDRHVDIVAASKIDGQIFIHYNDGKGRFVKKKNFPAQENSRALVIFDANKDSYPDVGVVTLTGRLSILLNDQDGGLSSSQILPAGVMAHDVIATDLDRDGDLDLMVLRVSEHSILCFVNDGRGKFQKGESIVTGSSPRVLKMGDIDGDGLEDLVVGGDAGKLYIHLQTSTGKFAQHRSLRSTAATWGLGLGDVDGNGSLDIIAASYHEKQLFIHLNKGDGSFHREQELLSGDHNFDLVLCDADLDGDLDIATCSTVDKALNLHLNDGKGIFGPRQKIDSGDWNAAIDAADLDGDGDIDLVLGAINDAGIWVHRNVAGDEAEAARKIPCIRGMVYDAGSKEAISRAQISLQDANGDPVEARMTAEDGSYTFCPPSNQTYTMIVRKEPFPVHREQITMLEEDMEKDIFLAMPTTARVYGHVIDKETAKPIPTASVRVKDANGNLTDTLEVDPKGRYEYDLPFGNTYQITAHAPSYDTTERFINLTEADFPNGRRIILRLSPLKDPLFACLSGVVRDEKTLEPISDARLEVRDIESDRYKKHQTDEVGAYQSCLPFGLYEITTTHTGYFFQVTPVEITLGDIAEGKKQDILLKPLEVGASIVLENIYYDVDKATLREESLQELERVLAIMNANPDMVVEIAGHTDSDGSDPHNDLLSHNRAQSVVDYLLASGIAAKRLEAIGYGEKQPVAPNDSPENKQLNRRTEFSVKSFDFIGLDE